VVEGVFLSLFLWEILMKLLAWVRQKEDEDEEKKRR
jgi:hypothetical protein